MTLLYLRGVRRRHRLLAVALILLGLGVVMVTPTYPRWGLPSGLPQSEALRLASLNAEISSLQQKFVEAELRGVRVHPVPRFFRDLLAERDSLVHKAGYAEGRPGRISKRVQYAGLVLMASGVAVYFLGRRRSRAVT